MKKMILMLVMVFATCAANSQIITHMGDEIVAGGMVYRYCDVPGAYSMRAGDNMAVAIQRYFTGLQRSNPAEYAREYNLYISRGGVQPIGTAAQFGYGMMAGGMAGGMMVGTGMNNSGMVMGTGGMAGATSNVNITNGNMVSTIGSGVNVMYDSNTGSVNLSGDPLMAIGRVVSAVGSGIQSRKAQKAAARQQSQPQQVVVYVDANTGQVIGQSQQPTTTTTRTATQAQAQPQHKYTYNATTGQYVPVQQVSTQQVQPVQQQPVQQQGQQVQQTQTNTTTTNTYSGF